ncbi:MAG TPA: hypothetical protein VN750_04585, partial [Steroidobacteraceae bacterium]|nr:hypothetical protein [Steroidobacteraceae bacterium]
QALKGLVGEHWADFDPAGLCARGLILMADARRHSPPRPIFEDGKLEPNQATAGPRRSCSGRRSRQSRGISCKINVTRP